MASIQDPDAPPSRPDPALETAPGPRRALPWTRRQLLAAATGIGGASLAGGLGLGAAASALAQPPQPATPEVAPELAPDDYLPRMTMLPARTPLVPPAEVASRDGLLRRELEVVQTTIAAPGLRPMTLPTFNRRLPGPTLRLAPGDRLRLCVYNLLPPNSDPAWVPQPNCPHHLNSLNLHFHGLRIATHGAADNPAISVPPGGWQGWEVEIPADHPGGTYWYHPLHHGATFRHLTAGLSGVLIVDGDFAAVPEIAAAREQVLLFQELQSRDGSQGPLPTINGQVQPLIRARPGEVQRWRLVHGGAGLTGGGVRLRLQGHRLPVIARDGRPLANLEDDDAPLLPVGGRLDVLVKAGFERGTYPLTLQRATARGDSGGGATGEPLPVALLEVLGDPRPMEMPGSLPALPPALAPLPEPSSQGRLARRTVTFELGEGDGAIRPTVDGQAYQPGRVDHRVDPGTVEEWRVVNRARLDVPVHLPGQPVELRAVTGETLPSPQWRDTVWIPADGEATLRVRFDEPGPRLFHTTLAELSDRGMQQTVMVGEPPAPADGPCGEPPEGCG